MQETREHIMWKRIAVVGATAVIIGGAGTAAFAASGTATPIPSPSSSGPASGGAASPPSTATGSTAADKTTESGRFRDVDRLRRAVHATWVSENKKTRTFTTHNAIRGLVTAVSPTSITVRAADSTVETYRVGSGTKVHTRTLKAAAKISDVRTGDPVFVAGTGTTTLTALRVVDAKK
jgi:hypothetical protein